MWFGFFVGIFAGVVLGVGLVGVLNTARGNSAV